MILTSTISRKEIMQAEELGHPLPITVILTINYNIDIKITKGIIFYLVNFSLPSVVAITSKTITPTLETSYYLTYIVHFD